MTIDTGSESDLLHETDQGGMDSAAAFDKGVQIVDPKNRKRQPKSKLNDSDLGPLAQALGGDRSI